MVGSIRYTGEVGLPPLETGGAGRRDNGGRSIQSPLTVAPGGREKLEYRGGGLDRSRVHKRWRLVAGRNKSTGEVGLVRTIGRSGEVGSDPEEERDGIRLRGGGEYSEHRRGGVRSP